MGCERLTYLCAERHGSKKPVLKIVHSKKELTPKNSAEDLRSYLKARYYSSWTCRFISTDPLARDYPQLTPYNYASNSPVGSLDVDGMQNPEQASGADQGGGNPQTDQVDLDSLSNQTFGTDQINQQTQNLDIIDFDQIGQGDTGLPTNDSRTRTSVSASGEEKSPAMKEALQIDYLDRHPEEFAPGTDAFSDLKWNDKASVVLNRAGTDLALMPKTVLTLSLPTKADYAKSGDLNGQAQLIAEGATFGMGGILLGAAIDKVATLITARAVAAYEVSVTTTVETTSLVAKYPANAAVPGTTERVFLQPGQMLDRYGSFQGKWFSEPGTSYGARSIPSGQTQYFKFQVVKPFEVTKSVASPGSFSGQTGLGTQYHSSVGANVLINKGIIIPVF